MTISGRGASDNHESIASKIRSRRCSAGLVRARRKMSAATSTAGQTEDLVRVVGFDHARAARERNTPKLRRKDVALFAVKGSCVLDQCLVTR
jgi:hypothetical protein